MSNGNDDDEEEYGIRIAPTGGYDDPEEDDSTTDTDSGGDTIDEGTSGGSDDPFQAPDDGGTTDTTTDDTTDGGDDTTYRDGPDLSLVGMNVSTDVNYVAVDFTVRNTGDFSGAKEYQVSIDLSRSDRLDYIENVEVNVGSNERVTTTIEFNTNLEEARNAEVCVNPA